MAQHAIGVHGANHFQIIEQRLGRISGLPQPADALAPLTGTAGLFARQVVQADAGMAVQVGVGRVLARQQREQAAQHQVFEHIGVVAGMEGVAVIHHRLLSRRRIVAGLGAWRSDCPTPFDFSPGITGFDDAGEAW